MAWSDKMLDTLRDGYQRGIPILKIAAECGVCTRSVTGKASMLGLKHPKNTTGHWPPERVVKLQKAYQNKEPLRDVAQNLGVSYSALLLKANNLQLSYDRHIATFSERVSPIPLKTLEKYIIKPGIENKIIPLCLYRGSVSPGRAHRLLNFSIMMMLYEAPNYTAGAGLSHNPKIAQLCGTVFPVQPISIRQFFGRLRGHPGITDEIPQLTEYVEWLHPAPCVLDPLSEIAIRADRHAWWRKSPSPKLRRSLESRESKPRAADIFYPYLIHEPGTEHELLLRVNNAVPKNIPDQFRADICQDLLVGILAGEIDKSALSDPVREVTRKVFQMYPTKYGNLSLDAPPPWSDDGRTLMEML